MSSANFQTYYVLSQEIDSKTRQIKSKTLRHVTTSFPNTLSLLLNIIWILLSSQLRIMVNQTLSPCPQQETCQMPCLNQDSLCLQHSCLSLTGWFYLVLRLLLSPFQASQRQRPCFLPYSTSFVFPVADRSDYSVNDTCSVYVGCQKFMSEWMDGQYKKWVWD